MGFPVAMRSVLEKTSEYPLFLTLIKSIRKMGVFSTPDRGSPDVFGRCWEILYIFHFDSVLNKTKLRRKKKLDRCHRSSVLIVATLPRRRSSPSVAVCHYISCVGYPAGSLYSLKGQTIGVCVRKIFFVRCLKWADVGRGYIEVVKGDLQRFFMLDFNDKAMNRFVEHQMLNTRPTVTDTSKSTATSRRLVPTHQTYWLDED
ncbi:CACTA en-spm transposon protein [Cucumis melo var. makuwa]|uniref:CACTA en-spm transposon protein n=1 Tax=Cucumis melo var. makuwa TaxID=1194695 RepID=A0A5A7UMQ7_CUCMM|nr:CACTA en-spm transposon protein [Cucumis melo var. makuwa]